MNSYAGHARRYKATDESHIRSRVINRAWGRPNIGPHIPDPDAARTQPSSLVIEECAKKLGLRDRGTAAVFAEKVR